MIAPTAVAAADRDIDKEEQHALAKELSEAELYRNPLAKAVLTSVYSGSPGAACSLAQSLYVVFKTKCAILLP